MKRFNNLFFGFIFGSTFPLLGFLLSLLTWFCADKTESRVLMYVIPGFIGGILIDILYLKGWINKKYELPLWFVIGIYIFYNICVYGLFMGFPVFNLFSGIIAGYYFGIRIYYKHRSADQQKKSINHVSIFTGFIMLLICISSGYIALAGIGVGRDLEAMLGLGFQVTRPMIWSVTVIGGLLLVLLQILVTKYSMTQTIKAYESGQRN